MIGREPRMAARPSRARFLPALTALALFAVSDARSAPVPFGRAQVSITAREEPIAAFLRGFFRQAGLTVVVSPDLTGAVNGAFDGPADHIYQGVAKAFDLLTYYDGAAVFVYPASQIATRTIDVPPAGASRVLRLVGQRGLTDDQNKLRLGAGRLLATGSERFFQQVSEVAANAGAMQEAGAWPPVRGGIGGEGFRAPPGPPIEIAPLEYRVYYLRYAWAEDVTMNFSGRQVSLPGVASILRTLLVDGGAPAQRIEDFGATGQGGLRTADVLGGANGASRGGADGGPLGYNLAANGPMPAPLASDAWNRVAEQDGDGGSPPVPAAPIGDTRVVADNRLNAVIIRDTRERLDGYDQLIHALDVEPELVEIEATIIDIDTDKVRQLGAGFSVSDTSGRSQITLGVGNNGLVGSPDGGGVFTTAIGAGNWQFRAGLQALISKGAAKVVAQPQVLTLSDVEAVLDNSKTFYVRVSGVQAGDLYNITAGTTLRVTPHITRDRSGTLIRMLVAIQDGSLSGKTVDRIPVVSNTGVNTQAVLTPGQSLLLGGLVAQTDKVAEDKVPGLGDIPLLGFFFRSSVKQSEHTERMFLLTPRVLEVGMDTTPPAGSEAIPGPRPPDRRHDSPSRSQEGVRSHVP